MQSEKKTMSIVLLIFIALAMFICFSVIITDEVSAASKIPGKVTKLTAKSDHSDGGVVLTWEKAKNAKSYKIYYSAKKKGKYKLFETREALRSQITLENLKPNKKYYFKVVAVNGKKIGKSSAVKSARAVVPMPYYEPEYYSDDILCVSYWLGEMGKYKPILEIYRSNEKDGPYNQIATIKEFDGWYGEYIDAGLSFDRYFYKMRVYCKIGGKNIYSKFNEPETGAIPKTVQVTLDNWDDYFEIVSTQRVDGDCTYCSQVISLKNEYELVQGVDVDTAVSYDAEFTRYPRSMTKDPVTGEVTIGDIISSYGNSEYEPVKDDSWGWIDRAYDSEKDEVTMRGGEILTQYIYLGDDVIWVAEDIEITRIEGQICIVQRY